MVDFGFWKNKKVFLTGHTGFKGSWTSLWLLKMGAHVTGYALQPPTQPSLFDELRISQDMNSILGDVRHLDQLKKSIKEAQPEIVIHMAAQPLVRYSYQEPLETYMTNVIGTVNLFEAIRSTSSVRSIVNVTSDKCYENHERKAGYKEHEPMGGYDPYSNSKGCSELVTSAYRNSFFNQSGVLLASGRAGNVIGGGDWAQDRLIPDTVRSVINKNVLSIRNPSAVRPWQHVLEPVYGYLQLAQKLYEQDLACASAFNFGPEDSDHRTVEYILQAMNRFWNNAIKYEVVHSDNNPHEAHLLALDCSKAKTSLSWKPRWNLDIALEATVDWHKRRLQGESVVDNTLRQISEYQER